MAHLGNESECEKEKERKRERERERERVSDPYLEGRNEMRKPF